MITKDTKLYYCASQGHYWYYADDDLDQEHPLFYKNPGDVTDEEAEKAENKYCGCNDH